MKTQVVNIFVRIRLLFRLGLKSQTRYLANLVGFLVLTFLIFSSRVFYNESVFSFVDHIEGWSEFDVYLLITFSILYSLAAAPFYASINYFFYNVASVGIESFLARPFSVIELLFFRWIQPFSFVSFLIFLVLTIILNYDSLHSDYELGIVTLLLIPISMVIGVFGNMLLLVLLQSLSFWLQRNIEAEYMYNELYRFSQLPPDLLFKKFPLMAIAIAPVLLSSAATVMILNASYMLFFIQLISTAFFALLVKYSFEFLFSRYDGVGG